MSGLAHSTNTDIVCWGVDPFNGFGCLSVIIFCVASLAADASGDPGVTGLVLGFARALLVSPVVIDFLVVYCCMPIIIDITKKTIKTI